MTSPEVRSVAEIKVMLASTTGAAFERLAAQLEQDDRAGVRQALAVARTREAAGRREHARILGLYALERRLAKDGFSIVAGVDEVGRGALAGPLTAGACVLPPSPRIAGLDDSKRLTPSRREELAYTLREVAVCWSVAHVEAAEIDAVGMASALRRAMGRALAGLELEPDHVVVDGLPVGIAVSETAVVKGDSKVAAIAAASILAKVTRDALMVSLASQHPEYRFDVNKGYGTTEHLEVIARVGLSVQHRRSFTSGGGTARLF